jgi:predicted flap endonuclease-1-like 5' DNA nuclease
MEKPAGRIVEPASIKPDDLIIIKGIGPVINRKLNQAGIYTFKQLAAITPARLREIVGEVIQRLADEETILAQARDLATRQ